MHDYVDAYIQRYGQKKMFNKEFLEYLNQQMNGIVKYDPDVGEQVGYIVEEYWAGVVGVVETVLRLGTGAVLNAIGEGVGLLGAEEAKAGWKDAATTVLGESYTQDWRENNLKKYTMTPGVFIESYADNHQIFSISVFIKELDDSDFEEAKW